MPPDMTLTQAKTLRRSDKVAVTGLPQILTGRFLGTVQNPSGLFVKGIWTMPNGQSYTHSYPVEFIQIP